jgi:hypothetical protein
MDNSAEPPPGEVIASHGDGEVTWYTASATGSGFVLRFPNVGEFVISDDLAQVTVRRDPSGRPEVLPILLAGTASAFLLSLRGQTVLHASAVAVDGSVLAFVGQSGRGKSTVAALLCVDGAELVTDDVLTVDVGPPVICEGSAGELRLRAAAAPIAEAGPGHRTRRTADDRLAFSPRSAWQGPRPLTAIVIPSPSRTMGEVAVRRLPASSALFTLLSFPRVHGWTRADVLSRDFATISTVVNQIPVAEVAIPWGPPFDPEVTRALSELATRDWSSASGDGTVG